jgi:hypothetical protein
MQSTLQISTIKSLAPTARPQLVHIPAHSNQPTDSASAVLCLQHSTCSVYCCSAPQCLSASACCFA